MCGKRSLRNASIGLVVTALLEFAPPLALVAPTVGGAFAGLLESDGPRGGVRVGALTGAFAATFGAVLVVLDATVTTVGTPLWQGWTSPAMDGVAWTAATWLGVAALGTAFSTAGGAVGGIVGDLLSDASTLQVRTAVGAVAGGREVPTRSVASVLAGVGAFGLVTIAVTAALDPYVWPSVLAGVLAGTFAGALVTVGAGRYLADGGQGTASGRSQRAP